MYSFTKAFSFVLVAAAIGVQAETHTVHFQNKYVLLSVWSHTNADSENQFSRSCGFGTVCLVV